MSTAFQTNAFQLDAFQILGGGAAAAIVIIRGDDVWRRREPTGKQAIYQRLIDEIEERFIEAPVPKTYRKRKARIIALTKAIEELPPVIRPAYYDAKPFTAELAEYDGSTAQYEALMGALEQQLAAIVAHETRRLKHRNIAIAMLLST